MSRIADGYAMPPLCGGTRRENVFKGVTDEECSDSPCVWLHRRGHGDRHPVLLRLEALPMTHIHDFHIHVGIPVFGGERLAWVDHRFVDHVGDGPFMWRCSGCGEQGFAIPDTLEVGAE